MRWRFGGAGAERASPFPRERIRGNTNVRGYARRAEAL